MKMMKENSNIRHYRLFEDLVGRKDCVNDYKEY